MGVGEERVGVWQGAKGRRRNGPAGLLEEGIGAGVGWNEREERRRRKTGTRRYLTCLPTRQSGLRARSSAGSTSGYPRFPPYALLAPFSRVRSLFSLLFFLASFSFLLSFLPSFLSFVPLRYILDSLLSRSIFRRVKNSSSRLQLRQGGWTNSRSREEEEEEEKEEEVEEEEEEKERYG